jgi:hypothetical protein
VLNQQLTRSEEEQEKEVPECKATIGDTLKGLEAAIKCVCEFCVEDNLVVTCNRFENALYRLSRAWGSVVVKALRYWPGSLGFNSRWCHWGIFRSY